LDKTMFPTAIFGNPDGSGLVVGEGEGEREGESDAAGRRRHVADMLLTSKNLNNLPVLHALLVESSVVGAAKRVGLSQPTVSGVLAKLRVEFGDPLLVRAGRGMRRTPLAERLLPEVAELCGGLERLYDPAELDPARLERRYVIAAPDHLAFMLAPVLLRILTTEAPGVQIRFVAVPADLAAPIRDDGIDLAVCGNFGFWPELRFDLLFEERIVLAVGAEHPLVGQGPITSEDAAGYPVLGMGSGVFERGEGRYATGVPVLDIEPQVIFSQFTDAVMLTIGTDFVAPAPEALVERLGRSLPVVGMSLAETDVVQAGMFWSATRERDAEHSWLRSVVERAARTMV
jgi:DNA-binding transcriptional LysR family regulator